MSSPPVIFDAMLVRRRLDRAARVPSRPDFLLKRVEGDLAERLAIVRRNFADAACFGVYSSSLPEMVRAVTRAEHVTSVAASDGVWDLLAEPKVMPESGVLPFAPQSLDLIVSVLWLHLENDLPGVLAQAQRALKPDGLLMASLLGGATLNELRSAWLIAEEELTGGASPRVAPFGDVRDLGGLLQRAGFALPVVDADTVTVTYASPFALMQDLKAMGMSNMLHARRRVPVTRTLLMRAAEVYAERFGSADGRIPATFEIITLTGWSPDASQPKPLKPGSAQVSLAHVLNPTPRDPSAKE